MAIHLNATADIMTHVELAANAGPGVINPETFYSKQLLDTIRYDANQYVYFRLADTTPIQEKADKLQVRRWAPLQAHTVPLVEGVPPKSDKGSVEKYEINADQYGRFMEFSDKCSFEVVDPIIAHYTKEYSLVAMETLDMLARECLFGIAQQYLAGGAPNFAALRPTDEFKPNMTDLRLVVLAMKRMLVKPRSNGRFHVIASPEFYFDMISDPTVKQYMTLNQTTKTMFDSSMLVPMFEMEFYEALTVPAGSDFMDGTVKAKLMVKNESGVITTKVCKATDVISATTKPVMEVVSGYVQDSRTGQDASYIPKQEVWDLEGWSDQEGGDWTELIAHHILIIGKEAMTRTGLQGEDSAKVYAKPLGSTGVLDPIDQRQSIGFKLNSVGFGSTRLEAVVDYICVPSQANIVGDYTD